MNYTISEFAIFGMSVYLSRTSVCKTMIEFYYSTCKVISEKELCTVHMYMFKGGAHIYVTYAHGA